MFRVTVNVMRSKRAGIWTIFVFIILFCVLRYRGTQNTSERENEQQRSIIFPAEEDINKKLFSCQNAEECFHMHVKNPGLAYVLKDRCSMGNKTNLHTYNLTFTHIPKCGGTSLRHLLCINKHFKSRFQCMETNLGHHIPFFLSQKLYPQDIFFTVFREPTSLAISLYNYINMRKTIPKYLRHDQFWMKTYHRDPVEWSNDAFIRNSLRNQVLRFFTWYSKTAKYGVMGRGVADFTNPVVWREFLSLPNRYAKVLDPWVPWSQEKEDMVSNYSLSMPLDYRCFSELRVASILIQRYSAVGIMEDFHSFLHVLHHRAQLDDESFSALMTDSNERRNPSTSQISSDTLQIIKSNLHDNLFCSRLLWKLASLINHHDSQCYANNTNI